MYPLYNWLSQGRLRGVCPRSAGLHECEENLSISVALRTYFMRVRVGAAFLTEKKIT